MAMLEVIANQNGVAGTPHRQQIADREEDDITQHVGLTILDKFPKDTM